jgi:hypothetical protein
MVATGEKVDIRVACDWVRRVTSSVQRMLLGQARDVISAVHAVGPGA